MRPCTSEDRGICRAQFGAGKNLDWACAHCKQVKAEEVSLYTNWLLFMHRLVKAGYPLGADELDLDTWHDLGLVAEILEQCREQQRWQGILKPILSG